MDINSKTQQVNTFLKGMDTDTSDALLSNESYRLAKNLRFFTDTESNTGELHSIAGEKKYTVSNITGSNIEILKTFSIRNIGGFIIRNVGIQDSWSIYVFDNNEDVDDVNCTITTRLVFGPCSTRIWRVNGRQIVCNLSVVCNWESEEIIRVYIADGIHLILCVNVAPNATIHTDIRSIINGGGAYLLPASVEKYRYGTVKGPVVQYTYRLYNKAGNHTPIAPTSELFSVSFTNSGITSGVDTSMFGNHGIKLKIDPPVSDYDRIQIYRIVYQSNVIPPIVELFYDSTIAVDNIYYDSSNNVISTYVLEELLGFDGTYIVPQIIESKDNYLFAANIKQHDNYQQDVLDWDARSYSWAYQVYDEDTQTYKNIRLLMHDNSDIVIAKDAILKCEQLDLTTFYFPLLWRSDDGWVGVGPNIKWKYVVDSDCELETHPDRDGTDTHSMSTYVPHIENKKAYRSLQRDEIYRYGIVLTDENGVKYPVKWICDIRTPDINHDMFFQYNGGKIYAWPLYIQFEIKNLPNVIKTVEIVRCNRTINDRATISQGIISNCLRTLSDDETVKYNRCGNTIPSVTKQQSYDYNTASLFALNYDVNDKTVDCAQFFSPEISYLSDDIESLYNANKGNLQLRPITALYVTNGRIKDNDPNDQSNITVFPGERIEKHIDEYTSQWYDFQFINTGLDFLYSKYDYKLWATDSDISFVSHNTDWAGAINYGHYAKYYGIYDSSLSRDHTIKIKSMVFPEVQKWNDFAEGDDILIEGLYTNIDNYKYYHWSSAAYINAYGDSDKLSDIANAINSSNSVVVSGGIPFATMPIGISGKCAVFTRDDSGGTLPQFNYINNSGDQYRKFCSVLYNLRKTNVTLTYGGYDTQTRNNSIYYSYGNVGSVENNTVTMDVKDGDVFISLFEFMSMHEWWDLNYHLVSTYGIVCSVPVETFIDLEHVKGDVFTKSATSSGSSTAAFAQDQPVEFNNGSLMFTQSKPMFLYDTAYSTSSMLQQYTNEEDEITPDADIRVMYSEQKAAAELIDSWATFKTLNYIDVDSRFGQISELKLFKNQLFFWLEHAAGLLSVNERSQVVDLSNAPLLLGTGGILSRYDYVTTSAGMKAFLFASTQSESTLYWFDAYNKELFAYRGGQQTIPLSKTKNVLNIINSTTISNNPHLLYDKKHNEVIATVFDDKSLVFSERQDAFSSLYDTHPVHSIDIDNILYTVYNKDVKKWDVHGNGFEPYLEYVVNANPMYTKVFDTCQFGGRFYGGDYTTVNSGDYIPVKFEFDTPLKQHGEVAGNKITNHEYNFRFAIPRNNGSDHGDRLRGNTMRGKMYFDIPLTTGEQSPEFEWSDFSLQYIITKYRISYV